jgi:hypothetical protein
LHHSHDHKKPLPPEEVFYFSTDRLFISTGSTQDQVMSQLLSAAFTSRAHDLDAWSRKLSITGFLLPAMFFVYFFLHFWRIVNPLVLYSLNGIGGYSYLFELRWGFLLGTIKNPGGVVLYSAGLITHACHEPWLGALILTCIAVLFFAATHAYVRACGRVPYFPLPYIPAVFMLLCYNWYVHRCIVTLLGVLGALLLGKVYQAAVKRAAALRVAVAAVLFILAYQGLGLAASVLFSLLTLMYEYSRNGRRSFLFAVIFLSCALLINSIQYHVFNGYAAFDSLRLTKTEAFWPLYLYYPLVMALLGMEAKIHHLLTERFHRISGAWKSAGKRSAGDSNDKKGRRAQAPSHPTRQAPGVRVSIASLLLFAAMIGVSVVSLRVERKETGLRIAYLRAGQWSKILDLGTRSLVGPLYIINMHIVDLALAESGLLTTRMFHFPQVSDPDALLLINASMEGSDINTIAWSIAFETYLRLGALNYAEKSAGEAMGRDAPHPFYLWPRALACGAKGQIETARAYANKLCAIPFYRARATAMVKDLDDEAKFFAREDISRIRSFCDTVDHLMYKADADEILLGLLAGNPRNKIAFEYLMAYYLQSKQLFKLVQNLRRIENFDYTATPVYIEEAVLIFSRIAGVPTETFLHRPLRRETYDRMAAFDASYETNKNAENPARALFPRFGSTYFYFFAFGFSGAVR